MSPFKVGALLCATSFMGIYSYFQFAASDSYTTDIAYIDGQVITHRAPHDATVKEVKVSLGQMTNDNTTLFLLDAPALEDALHHASLDIEALTEKYAALSAQLNQLRITEGALQNEYQLANQAVLTSHELSGIYRAAQKQGNVDKITVTQHHIEHLTLEKSALSPAHVVAKPLCHVKHGSGAD
jgi:multidrug resistance efflux pump